MTNLTRPFVALACLMALAEPAAADDRLIQAAARGDAAAVGLLFDLLS